MFSVFKSNLGRRLILLVIISTALVLTGLTISGWLAVHQSSERVFEEREALARSTATYLDYILTQNLARLDGLAFSSGLNIATGEFTTVERELHTIHISSVFDGVFITNNAGDILWMEPSSGLAGADLNAIPIIKLSLTAKRPAVSDVVTIGAGRMEAVLIVTPVRNGEGAVTGLVGGWIDPLEQGLSQVIQSVQPGLTSHTDIVDSRGIIIASSDPNRVQTDAASGTGSETEVVRSAPLSTAPWSVVVAQSTAEALAPVRTMALQFTLTGIGSLAVALFFAWGMAQSLIKPIGQLSASVRSISRGDLSQPVPQLGGDEIGQLGLSFDSMRLELKKSLEEIQRWNRELEAKVEERTRQLEESFREIERKEADRGRLLQQVLTAQEEERKRIARELHDETTQALVGLVLRLEALMAVSNVTDADKSRLAELKSLAVRTIDNVHKIIFDLRPAVLDDLGLVSAIRWYAEHRLGAENVGVRIEVAGTERKLPSAVEIALFRVVQEAVTNIIRHAEASNVVLSLEFAPRAVRIEIEDDGKGFDPAAMNQQADKIEGVGLLGMRERITLIGGKFSVASQPGGGTHITIEVSRV